MSENDHDWAARRHQQNASDLWGSEGGSFNHWNAHLAAEESRRLADEQRAREAVAKASPAPIWSPPSPQIGGVATHHSSCITPAATGPIDESQIGLILWKLCKSTVLPLLMLSIVIVAGGWGVRQADQAWMRRDPDGGLTRYATARVFGGEELAPPSTFLSSKEEANVLHGSALIAAMRRVRRPFVASEPRNARLLASAYRCQTSDACRSSIRQLAPELEIPMVDLAVSYLGVKAKAGSEIAARDGCLMPLLTVSTPQAVFLGRNACAMMVVANGQSNEARRHLATMDRSGLFKLARAISAEGP